MLSLALGLMRYILSGFYTVIEPLEYLTGKVHDPMLPVSLWGLYPTPDPFLVIKVSITKLSFEIELFRQDH